MGKELRKKRFKKYLNVKLATNPGRVVINSIIIFNIILFLVSAIILRSFKIDGTENMGFLKATFYVLRLILSNNMHYEAIGPDAIGIGIFTIVVMILSTIFFTGSLIAYLTNYISKYMGYKNPALKKLYLYNHIILLGWNVRATEIIRNLLFTGKKHEIVILANEDREKIEDAIEDAVGDALYARNTKLKQMYKQYPLLKRIYKYNKDKLRNRLTIMIKTGETYSNQQLQSISLNRAESIIILGENVNNFIPEETDGEKYDARYGNSQSIKTVAQVSNIANSNMSLDNQNIIVEVDDLVTLDLVSKIMDSKKGSNKCKIIPMPVTYTMGSLVSQFALNPEMGPIFNELLSQYGLTISVEETNEADTIEYVRNYFKTHKSSLPLSSSILQGKGFGFYIGEAGDKEETIELEYAPIPLKLKDCVRTTFNDVIIFGENAQFAQLLESIDTTVGAHGGSTRILVISHKKISSKKYGMNNCDIQTLYTNEDDPIRIYNELISFIKSAKEDVTMVLLANNFVGIEHADDETIATLVRIGELQHKIEIDNPEIDPKKIKIVVELLDPKHHDVIKSFGVHNVIISNRLTSKMITQFSFESSLYGLFLELLVKNREAGSSSNSILNNNMYTLHVKDCFEEIPKDITAYDLVR